MIACPLKSDACHPAKERFSVFSDTLQREVNVFPRCLNESDRTAESLGPSHPLGLAITFLFPWWISSQKGPRCVHMDKPGAASVARPRPRWAPRMLAVLCRVLQVMPSPGLSLSIQRIFIETHEVLGSEDGILSRKTPQAYPWGSQCNPRERQQTRNYNLGRLSEAERPTTDSPPPWPPPCLRASGPPLTRGCAGQSGEPRPQLPPLLRKGSSLLVSSAPRASPVTRSQEPEANSRELPSPKPHRTKRTDAILTATHKPGLLPEFSTYMAPSNRLPVPGYSRSSPRRPLPPGSHIWSWECPLKPQYLPSTAPQHSRLWGPTPVLNALSQHFRSKGSSLRH